MTAGDTMRDEAASDATPFRPRILHAMLRVRDLDRSLAFYCGLLGMRERRRIRIGDRTLVFIGFDAWPEGAEIELWHEAAGEPRPLTGAGAGHVGIAVDRIVECCAWLAARGVAIIHGPAPLRPGGRPLALLHDPDGHEIELLGDLPR